MKLPLRTISREGNTMVVMLDRDFVDGPGADMRTILEPIFSSAAPAGADGKAAEPARWVIVDCSDRNDITSSTIAMLLVTHQLARDYHGGVVLSGLRKTVADVLRVTRLDRLLKCYPDVNTAREALMAAAAHG